MTLLGKIQMAILAGVAVLLALQTRHHANQKGELAALADELQSKQQELATRHPALDALEQHNQELEETERRAGNETLLALMRERAAYSQSTRESVEQRGQTQGIGGALAKVLDSPDQWEVEREQLRNQIRAEMGTFFRLAKVPAERVDQFIDLSVEAEHRKSARLSALLHGTIAVGDALRERDADEADFQKKQQEVLGDEAYSFLNGIAEGMRTDEAKRLLKLIRDNMGDNPLNQDQSDRLQSLIKSQIVSLKMDGVELFRPADEWARSYAQRQQNVLQGLADSLTPAQIETLKAIGAYDLADRQKQMEASRVSLGITSR
ncbi:MAG TPA: hypothetical protein VLT36_14560 [Candidatus Dormibacteraeota bacterium]|nr:hypothetical protein [Candidatus Dormibacteraeota bacterium]